MDHCGESLRYCNWLVGPFSLCSRYFMYENFKSDACYLQAKKKQKQKYKQKPKEKKPKFKAFNFSLSDIVVSPILSFLSCKNYHVTVVRFLCVFFSCQTCSKQPYCNQFICLLSSLYFSFSILKLLTISQFI